MEFEIAFASTIQRSRRVIRRNVAFAAMLGLGVLAPVQGQVARTPHQQVPDFLGWVQDEVVVVFKPMAARNMATAVDMSGSPMVNVPSVQTILDQFRANQMTRQFKTTRIPAANSSRPDLTGHYKVKVPRGTNLDDLVAAFEADPAVDHVERIGIHSLYGEPNDPYFRVSPNPSFPFDQWHYHNGITGSVNSEGRLGHRVR